MMKRSIKIFYYCLLCLLWLVPDAVNGVSVSQDFLPVLIADGVFVVTVAVCLLVKNAYAALSVAAALGIAIGIYRPQSAFDILPVLALCGVRRCVYEENAGRSLIAMPSVFVNLVYAGIIAVPVNVLRDGFRLENAGVVDVIYLIVFVSAFVLMFVFGDHNGSDVAEKGKNRKGRSKDAGCRSVGLIPLRLRFRELYLLSAVLVFELFAQAYNGCDASRSFIVLTTGSHFLLLPAALYFFVSLDEPAGGVELALMMLKEKARKRIG